MTEEDSGSMFRRNFGTSTLHYKSLKNPECQHASDIRRDNLKNCTKMSRISQMAERRSRSGSTAA